jgi:NADH-quinone oxidoreductase subunit N
MTLASAVELITIYLALELSSYSLYALIPLRSREPRAAEAGIKYILFGAAATALSLFGLAYILASQHSSYLAALTAAPWSWAEAPVGIIGLTLFMAGFFYKLALFPFHFWAPDVYDGASNETAAYAATLPKLGAVVVLIRLAAMLKPGLQVTTVLAVLGAASMTFGNLAALTQQDIKRMLGYSSVAHAGYVMVGLVAASASGLAAAGFYSLIYVLMNLTCFWVICRLSADGRNLKLNDLDGLYRRAPFLAFVLAVAALALVGLPPTAGFMGKLFLLSAAWNRGYDWLVVVAALNTAISIYYYLNLIRHAYTVEADGEAAGPPPDGALWGGVLAGLLLVLGAVPAPVFRWAEAAGRQLMP